MGTAVVRDETKHDCYMVLPFVEYDLDHAVNAINAPFNTAQVFFVDQELFSIIPTSIS